MQEVFIDRIGLSRRERNWDVVGLGVLEQARARSQIPLPPRRNHLDPRVERVVGELETDLVVALARRSMGNVRGPFPMRNLKLFFGNQRPGDRCAEEISPLVDGVGPKDREGKAPGKLFFYIGNVHLGSPGGIGLFLDGLQVFLLADVGHECDYLKPFFFNEPFEDNRSIQPTRVGQHDLLAFASHSFSF